MSTIEDFENAPVGATAEGGKWVKFRPTNDYCSEWVEVLAPSNPKTEGASRSNRDMFCDVYTLDPSPVTPTTAREALALAWELSDPMKEGHDLPIGTECIAKVRDGEFMVYRSEKPFDGVSRPGWAEVRTLDPLPEPEPGWLDAPAVMAHAEDEEPHVWVNVDAQGWRDEHGNTRHWATLRDVTPLWPKEQDA